MEKTRFRTVAFLISFLLMNSFSAVAAPEMADSFRADGKIYVVVAVVCIILIGLFALLFWMDRRLTKLEKK